MNRIEANGGPKQVPAILVGWDADKQAIHLEFDTTQFRTWDFVLAVLEMARSKAEEGRRAAIMGAMQAQAVNAAQEEALRRQLRH